ncbi:hypothetical protein HTZ77_00115 [Nonomuraea sp. SMC257]|uniref:DUF1440 domain-containing protein n=1 Tax=Nonomuraea montanisoli TaxID=2741721 RepID=A0A7Y6I1N6_9ACTN|nr:hypothetical protein [Nonomuraea montanisoli]
MLRHLVNGAIGGALATAAMSTVMVAGQRAGLMGDQPPKRIVRAILPGHPRKPKPGEGVLATAAHFAFGMGSGALFGVLTRGRGRVPLGVLYGLAIWYGSYAGWVPRLTTLPPAHRDRPGRQAVMAAGHVVYGVALANAVNRLDHRAAEAA